MQLLSCSAVCGGGGADVGLSVARQLYLTLAAGCVIPWRQLLLLQLHLRYCCLLEVGPPPSRRASGGASTPASPGPGPASPAISPATSPATPPIGNNHALQQRLATLRELCVRADTAKAGWVPRISFERWLRKEGRPVAARLDAADLLELLDAHSTGGCPMRRPWTWGSCRC